MVYRYGHFIPQHTVRKFPEFATYRGFLKDRQKVASTFLKPTTWEEYCSIVVTEDQCKSGNSTIARRLPRDENERKKYFLKNAYKGHFRETNDMDCSNNANCSGHFINTDCALRSNSEAQMYWNNVPLVSVGPAENGGYSDKQAIEIWNAANATRSHVLISWGQPSVYLGNYAGDWNSSFFRVAFPESTPECREKQLSKPLVCTSDRSQRIGDSPLYRCDYPEEYTEKIISAELKRIYDEAPEEEKSPALDFLNAFRIEDSTMQEIFTEISRIGLKLILYEEGYVDREAVCKWVYDNLENIVKSMIPSGYPRTFVEETNVKLANAAISISCICLVCLICIIFITIKFRNKSAIRFAQLSFLVWMMGGAS